RDSSVTGVQTCALPIYRRRRVVHPVDGDLGDLQAVVLGEQQELGVEEPVLVLDLREQPAGDVGPHRLEAALRVAELGAGHGLDRSEERRVGKECRPRWW